jgi:hypothetical protein
MKNKYYTSCSTLSVFRFYKIVDENNLNFLVKGFEDGDTEFKYSAEAEEIAQKILEEYAELTSNKEIVVGLNLRIKIAEFQFEKDILEGVLDSFNTYEDYSVLSLLTDFGFDIKEGDNLNIKFSKVISRIKSLNNKIKINKSKYTERFKKNSEEIKRNLIKEALNLEMGLELGRKINVHTTMVDEWVAMVELSTLKAKALENSRNK